MMAAVPAHQALATAGSRTTAGTSGGCSAVRCTSSGVEAADWYDTDWYKGCGQHARYRFLVLEDEGEVRGYASWGPTPGTVASADLYWIAVHPGKQDKGLGKRILKAAEEAMVLAGRTRVYLETSTRAQYEPTRAFYLKCGYQLAAELPDFYAPGDGKAIFAKVLGFSG